MFNENKSSCFNVGDKVKCIDSGNPYLNLFRNQVYTVKCVDKTLIELEEIKYWWSKPRFELVKEDPMMTMMRLNLETNKKEVSEYNRGWNDCVAHFATMFLRSE